MGTHLRKSLKNMAVVGVGSEISSANFPELLGKYREILSFFSIVRFDPLNLAQKSMGYDQTP